MTGVARRLAFMAAIGFGLAMSSPSLAQAAVSIPQPTDMTLLALAVAGLVVGRHAARRRLED
jgi:hypothetical protein